MLMIVLSARSRSARQPDVGRLTVDFPEQRRELAIQRGAVALERAEADCVAKLFN